MVMKPKPGTIVQVGRANSPGYLVLGTYTVTSHSRTIRNMWILDALGQVIGGVPEEEAILTPSKMPRRGFAPFSEFIYQPNPIAKVKIVINWDTGDALADWTMHSAPYSFLDPDSISDSYGNAPCGTRVPVTPYLPWAIGYHSASFSVGDPFPTSWPQTPPHYIINNKRRWTK